MKAVSPQCSDQKRGMLDLISLCVAFIAAMALCIPLHAQDDREENGPDPVALFEKAQDAHEKGDLPAAIELYEKAIAAANEFPEAEYQRATALLALGRKDDAEKGLRKAIAVRPDWSLPIASLGSILIGKGEYGEAEGLLNRAIANDPHNAIALAALTELSLKTKASPEKLNELLKKLTLLTGRAKPTSSAWAARAALENALGERAAAKTSFARALELEPKNQFVLTAKASAMIDEGDLKGAESVVRTLESIAPAASSVIALQARILHANGRSKEALEKLNSIAEPAPEIAELRRNIKLSEIADPAEIEAELSKDTENVMLLGKLCTAYRISAPAKALENCRKASEKDPGNLSHALGYGAALVQARSFDQAVTLLRRLQTISPENLTLRANLATALFQLKRYTEAKTEFHWLTEKQPEAAAAYYFLGIIHDHLAEYPDAMVNYQLFLRKADAEGFKDEIDRVNLRLPVLHRQIKSGKGKR